MPYFAPDDPAPATKPSGSYGNSATGYNNSYLDDTIDKVKLAEPGVNILGIDLSGLLGGVVDALLGADLEKVAKYVASTNKIVTETGSRFVRTRGLARGARMPPSWIRYWEITPSASLAT